MNTLVSPNLNLADDALDNQYVAVAMLDEALARARMNAVAMVFGFTVQVMMGFTANVFAVSLLVGALALSVGIGRVVAFTSWRKLDDQAAALIRYTRYFQVMAAILGLAGVLALALIFPKVSIFSGSVMVIVMLGALSVALLSLSLVRWALSLYFIPACCGTLYAMGTSGQDGAHYFYLVIPVFLLITMRAGSDNFKRARDSVQQRMALERSAKALEQARLAAEAGNVAKTQFLATMSHEVRTPMNGLLGILELLDDGTLTPDQHHWIAMARTSGNGLIEVINDVLDYSKLEAGKTKLHHEPFVLREVLDAAVDLFRPAALKKQLQLSCVVQNDIPNAVKGDAVRLRQVLLNIIGNAVKFTQAGSVDVKVVPVVPVDVRAGTTSAHTLLRISVHDTGIGMPQDALGGLFQPFHQLDQSYARTYGGTGLGLAISKRLIEEMGGDISVTSEVEKGSAFVITVPLEVVKNIVQ